LVLGANCLQLYIQDGGSNDADGLVDGTVTNVSGVAVQITAEPVEPPQPQPIEDTFRSGGGCTVATGSSQDSSLMLLVALGLLRLVRGRLKRVLN